MRNAVNLVGRLTTDPVAVPRDGVLMVRFSVLTVRYSVRQDGTRTQRADAHRCVAFGEAANQLASRGRKGSMVYVEGPLRWKRVTHEGRTFSLCNVLCDAVWVCNGRPEPETIPDGLDDLWD